jgi:hypothetical protein
VEDSSCSREAADGQALNDVDDHRHHRLEREVETLRKGLLILARQVGELARRDNAGAGR